MSNDCPLRLMHVFVCFLLLCAPMHSAVEARRFNPIIPDTIADATVVEIDGVFYLYGTTDIDKGIEASGPLVVWKSRDFVNWSFEGSIYPEATNWRCWAPGTIHKKKDVYYMTVTVNGATRMVAGPSPEGPFHDPDGRDKWTGDEAARALCDIDGEMFVDDDKKAYLFWRQRKAAEMNSNWRQIGNRGNDVPSPRQDYSEGPFMFKRKGIYYYLYTLDGHADYKYAYLMSEESPLGPFVVPKEDIIARTSQNKHIWGPGHGCVFHPKGTGDYVFVYLEYGEGGSTRQVCANRMTFNADGTIVPVVLDWEGVGYLRPPSRTNVAAGAKAEASSMRADRMVRARADGKDVWRNTKYAPDQAVDRSNGTRWWAADGDKKPQLTVDIGKQRPVTRAELFFIFPTLGHAFVLDASKDRREWTRCGGTDTPVARSPHVVDITGSNRYFRVTITKGGPGLWEFAAY